MPVAISLDRTLLKSSPSRSVLRETGGVVLKRFHHPSLLGRLRDKHRAERERRALEQLRAAGLPAPRPLGVSRARGAWELHMQEVPGARTLEQLLASAEFAQGPLDSLAAALGQLLAQLERSGLHHPDLHAGNLLVDEAQQPWLVDPARLCSRAPKSSSLTSLVLLAAGVRESSSPRFRRHFLEAWWEATPTPPEQPRASFAEQVEALARAYRLKHVEGRLQRWLRTSGACVPLDSGERNGMRALAPIEPNSEERRIDFQGEEQAREAWLQLAKLREHNLPAWPPLELELAPAPGLRVSLPNGSRSLGAQPDARRLGGLLGALHDRGLALEQLQLTDLVQAADGKLMLGPVPCHAIDPKQAATPRADLLSLGFDPMTLAERAQFTRAYLRAHRNGTDERQRLRQELELEP
ncbi:MAG: hypothetical protein ACI9HE_000965 [Planctomycetota bacterium]